MSSENQFLEKLFDSARTELAPDDAKGRAMARFAGSPPTTAEGARPLAKASAAKGVATKLAIVAAAAAAVGVTRAAIHAVLERHPAAPVSHARANVAEMAKAPAPAIPSASPRVPLVLPSADNLGSLTTTPADDQCRQAVIKDEKPARCSGPGEPVLMEVVNACRAEPVDLYWIDSHCREVFYTQLAAGETHLQSTYSGQSWRVRIHATHELLKEVALGESSDAGTPTMVKRDFTVSAEDSATEPTPGDPAHCSEAGFDAEITLLNKRTAPVEVYWVDYDCREAFKGWVGPGDRWAQRARDANRFRVRDAQSHRLLKELVANPNSSGQRFYISIP